MAKSGSQLEDNLSSLSLDLGEQPSAPAAGEAQAPAATAPAPEQPAEPAAPAPPVAGADEPRLHSVAAQMRGWGYEVDDSATDDDVRSHLESLEDRASKYDETQKELEQLRQWRAQIEAQRQPEPAPAPAAKPAQAPAAAAPAPTADDLGIPERPVHDQLTVQVLQFAQGQGKLTEAGGFVATDDPMLRPHVDAYNKTLQEQRAYDAEWTQRKVAERIYEQRSAKDREERESLRKEIESLKAAQQTDKVQAEIDAYFEKHKSAYFSLDPNGEPVFDAQRQTYAGEGYARYMAAAQEALDYGITGRAAIHRYAAKHAPPTAAQPQQPPEQKVLKFRNRLKNNGHADPLAPAPVSRPSAAPATHSGRGLSLQQQLSRDFSVLMTENVGERM